MKKVILALGFFAFILFGAVSVQQVDAAVAGVEIVDLDKDPTKDGDKAKAEVKKGEKAGEACSKASDKGCCAKEAKGCKGSSTTMASKGNGDCAKECSKECPDKK
jgi:hypothetical protein